jgi:hypothetical protein
MRVLFFVFALLLIGCSGGNPAAGCQENPGICTAGQVCDQILNQCVVADMGSTVPVDFGIPPSTTPGCSADGWCWRNPLPQGNILNGFWGFGGSSGFAVGDRGTILKWDGASFTPQVSGTSRALYAVWGTDANNAWAVGDGGTILKWKKRAVIQKENPQASPHGEGLGMIGT